MNLSIRGFRGIEETGTLQLEKPVNLFVGPNAAGKSSILGAVHVGITGKHPEWTAGQKQSVFDLRRWETSSAEIDVYAHGHILKRIITGSKQALSVMPVVLDADGEVDRFESETGQGTNKEQQADLYSAWGLTAEQVDAVLATTQFLEMDAKTQTGFMAALGGAEVRWGEVITAIAEDNPYAYAAFVGAGVIDEIAKPGQEDGRPIGIALLDFFEKHAREARRAAKQERDRLAGALVELKSTVSPKPESDPVTDEDLLQLEHLGDARFAAEKMAGQIQAADVALEREKGRVGRNQIAYREKLAARDDGPSQEQITDANTAASNAQEQVDLANHALGIMDPKPADLQRAYENARARLEAVKQLEADGPCPTCKSPMTAEHISALRLNIGSEADGHQREYEAANELEAHLEGQRNGCFAALEAAETALARLQTARQDLQNAYDLAEGQVAEAEKALAAAQSARNGIGSPIDVAEINAELAALVLRKDEWKEYTVQKESVRIAGEQLSTQEARVEALEWAVKKFGSGPESYRVELLGDGLHALTTTINEYLLPYLGMQVIMPAGDVPLSVQRLREGADEHLLDEVVHPATLQFLSGSEYFRLQLILQYAFARALNFPIMLVDCEVQLDQTSANEVMAIMAHIADKWAELRILATTVYPGGNEMEYETDDWTDVWLVKDGKVALYDGPGDEGYTDASEHHVPA